jgi:putative endonuclease
MNKRELGNEKEDRAAEYLQQQGYEVIERNYHCGFAEIDIIAKEKDEIQGDYLCFVEVKYRSGDKFDAPEGVVSFSKQRKICQGVRFYMKEKRLSPDTPVRFDVIFVLGDEIRLIKNAFEYIR